MRKFGLLMVAGGLFFLASVAWVEGQQGGKGGKGGGVFGGFGTRTTNPFTLLVNADVKKELDVSDEQMEKLPAEMMTAISRVLNDKQFKRFKQIQLQQQRNAAFKDKAVQKQLSLTADQVKSIESILEDEGKEIAELFKGGGKGGKGGFGGFGKDSQEKTEKIRTESKEKIYNVLTKDQRKNWREMVGAEFKMSTPTFGGFGGKGKGTPKKKDA